MFDKLMGPLGALALSVTGALADGHGISMYGQPALPPDFGHLPYVNPDAPVGGRIVTASVGTFDSLNPFIRKGTVHWQLRFLIGESLMGRSLDEPFTLYGVLADSITTSANRDWVEFTLHPDARFSDGSPVTVDDVMWSFETMGTVGHPRYRGFWSKIASMEQVGDRGIRFTFNEDNPELALLAGLRPILKKAQWDGIDFAQSGTDVVPITSAPYVISDFEPGRFISLTRNPDYWGRDVVPFMKGQANLDEVRLEFFADTTAAQEAFSSGLVNFTREFNVGRWETQYDFPAVQSGEVVKEVLPHFRPSGMTGLVMNTRRDIFSDIRVRDALMHAFNFEFINDTLNGGVQPRITSYFSNSPLGMRPGPAQGKVRALLDPFQADLPSDALTGYTLPVSDGSERNRAGIGAALDLLAQAGWTVQNGSLRDTSGAPFDFDILLKQGDSEVQAVVDIYVQALDRLGVRPTVTVADAAQFKERTDAYDFDMTYYRRGLSLSPGNEQYLYFGSEHADTPGGRNLMGVKSPAVDAMIGALLTADSQDGFLAGARALDRALTAGRYVIPFYQWNISRLAHARQLNHPGTMPIFGDWPGWEPHVWWWQD